MSAEFWRTPRSTKLVIAIDFDGTLVENESGYPAIGASAGAEAYLRRLDELGAERVLWTVRMGHALAMATEWCATMGIPFQHVNADPQHADQTPKIHAHVFVDDRAFGVPLRVGSNGRPVVNWRIVGPALLELALRCHVARGG